MAVLFLLAALGSRSRELHAQEPDSVVLLEPVVVRVLRSAVGLGAPYSISLATRDELTRGTPQVYLEEALRALPGVQVQNRYNLAAGERLAVRGFGSRAQFGIRGVRVLVDGIPATLPDGQTALDHLDVSTLGRAELLRGPASALYGNAAGGVLHLESQPPARILQATLRSATGSDGLRVTGATITGPVGPGGYRVSASRYGYDGFRRDPVADDGSTYGRQERTVVSAAAQTPLATGLLRVVANGMDMNADNPGSLSQTLLDEGDRQAYRFSVLQQTREDIQQGQVGATWAGAVGGLEGRLSTWGLVRDFEGRIPSAVVAFDRRAGGARASVAATRTPGGARLSLGAGVEVEVQRDARENWANERGDKGSLALRQTENVRGLGAFAQARLEPGDALSLLAGLRYDAFRFTADDAFLEDGADDSGGRTMRAVSPSLGVVWRPRRRVELFGSVSTSFQTPTTTELTNRPDGAGGFNPDLDPTRAVSLEGGARLRMGRSWNVESTVFRTALRDELVPFEVPEAPGRTFYRNAGESTHRGWEITAEGRPVPSLGVRVAYTRVDARYQRYLLDGVDHSGNRIPGLSPHRLDGRVVWEGTRAFLEVRGLFQDAIPVDDTNTFESPSSFVADIRTGLRGLRAGHATVSPFLAVANVLDRRYNASVVVNAFGGRYYEPAPGRTFQGGVSVTFGG